MNFKFSIDNILMKLWMSGREKEGLCSAVEHRLRLQRLQKNGLVTIKNISRKLTLLDEIFRPSILFHVFVKAQI